MLVYWRVKVDLIGLMFFFVGGEYLHGHFLRLLYIWWCFDLWRGYIWGWIICVFWSIYHIFLLLMMQQRKQLVDFCSIPWCSRDRIQFFCPGRMLNMINAEDVMKVHAILIPNPSDLHRNITWPNMFLPSGIINGTTLPHRTLQLFSKGLNLMAFFSPSPWWISIATLSNRYSNPSQTKDDNMTPATLFFLKDMISASHTTHGTDIFTY